MVPFEERKQNEAFSQFGEPSSGSVRSGRTSLSGSELATKMTTTEKDEVQSLVSTCVELVLANVGGCEANFLIAIHSNS